MPITSTFGAMAARGFGLFSAIKQAVDEYFEYVTMLLPGNGTNGAQNNTFVDASTNNFTITRNGNTTQGTFTPYGANWSNYFDGSGDQLTAAANNAFVFGTGDFCIEGFFFVTANSTSNIATIVSNTAGGNNGWIFSYYTGGFRFQSTGVLLFQITSSLNTWHHVVICRASGTTSIFIDGVRQDTTSTAYTWSDNSTLNIGYRGADAYFTGYMSNVRLVKGSSVYDPTQTTLTVPTAPLTAITNTSLLTCQSNRFIDNSANAFTITRNGDVSVQRFSPFSPTAAYSTSVVGGSGYFDGSGDYLTVPSNAAFGFGTGNYTIEFFCNMQFVPSGTSAIFGIPFGGGDGLYAYLNSAGRIVVYQGNIGNMQSTSTGYQGTWVHVAICRSAGTLNVFFDGISPQSYSDSRDWGSSNYLEIGRNTPNFGNFGSGYVSNFRVVKGTALYTATFTPPTAPLTAITNTSLLLNYTNAGVIDNAMMNNLETVGNAQISTTQSKWGGSSMYFDGTGDYLVGASTPQIAVGSTFTVECWVYRAVGSTIQWIVGNNAGSGDTKWLLEIEANNTVYGGGWTTGTQTVSTVPVAAWTHIAMVCNSGSLKIYIDGVQSGTAGSGANFTESDITYIGQYSGGTRNLTGYIDDLRITKGYARYTANFTVPAGAFPTR